MSAVVSAIQFAGFSDFTRALKQSGCGEILDKGGPYTVFAPTDEAFAKFPPAMIKKLFGGDADLLRAVVSHHFAPGKVMAGRFDGKRIRAKTHGGQTLLIDGKDGLRVEDANVVRPDLVVGETVIHGIDGVLWPHEPVAAVL